MSAWDEVFVESVLGDGGKDALRRTNAYLIDHRNQRFMARLQDELPRGGVFVAVGAGHIPGENGLVEMLRGNGYAVTRIALPGEAG